MLISFEQNTSSGKCSWKSLPKEIIKLKKSGSDSEIR